jgi:rod shape-determining protein MreC
MARAIDNHQTPAFFVRGPSPMARLVFFSALSFALMVTDSRLNYLIEVRQGLVGLMQPVQAFANMPSQVYRTIQSYFSTQKTLLKENAKLSEQILLDTTKLQQLNSLSQENAHLRQLLGAAQTFSQPAKVAEILHTGRDPFTHKVMVNVGSRQEVVAGQAVVDGQGVIGQVTRIYPYSSEVTLITDKDLAIPVQVERNGLRAIAFGHGRDTAIDLPYLPANVDIKKGDKLITSGIDGIYPSGLAVAEVVKIERNPDSPFAHIVSKPLAGIENHKQVLLIGIPKVEPSLLSPQDMVINKQAQQTQAPALTKPTKPQKPMESRRAVR